MSLEPMWRRAGIPFRTRLTASRPDLRSLRLRLVLALLLLAGATVALIGVPTAVLVHRELEREAWTRVDEGVRVSRALYDAHARDVSSFALLTAQRPTLRTIIQQGGVPSQAYLDDLRAASGITALVVLDKDGQVLGQSSAADSVGAVAAAALRQGGPSAADALSLRTTPDSVILTAEAPILPEKTGDPLGIVRAGVALDSGFAERLKQQTGLDHSVVMGDRRLATSLGETAAGAPPVADRDNPREITYQDSTYYAAWLPLGTADGVAVADEVALSGAAVGATMARVNTILFASGVVFAALVAALGYVLAQRIAQPLLRLSQGGEALGRGDLSTPLPPADGVSEIAGLRQTLEQMRRRLKTAHDELSQSKAWAENLVAALSEGVLTIDADGRVTSFSSGAEHLLGWRRHEVIGRRYGMVLRPAGAGTAVPRPAPGAVERLRVCTRDGRTIVIALTGGALVARGGPAQEQAFVFRDVTEEDQAQRLREFFLANVSHEFKTPLAALRAATELLTLEGEQLSEAEAHELLDSITLGVVRLEELVENLLSSALIQAGHFEVRPRPVDLHAILEEALLTTRPLLSLRGQTLALNVPPDLPLVQADPRRLMQVLVNLISNASKYGPREHPIRVSVAAHGGMAVTRVADEGPGIPEEQVALLFRPFKRPVEGEKTAGVGLGLSIVKTIVERHGGEVGVESRPGATVFWFTLPLAPGM
ncbi:MAG: ATP-binding protein [Anaerolineae bacterium]